MIDILFASNNKGKYDELVYDFKNAGINLIFDGSLTLHEEGDTLVENSREKAIQASAQRNMYALSDDSGVFVEALDFFPGAHSRRWAGTEKEDDLRNEKVLEMMDSEPDRDAYLISRFTLVNPQQEVIGRYAVKNKFTVSTEEKGDLGFGYDKILEPSPDMLKDYANRCPAFSRDSYTYGEWMSLAEKIEKDHMTVAQLTQGEKNAICNRGRIAEEVKKTLEYYCVPESDM